MPLRGVDHPDVVRGEAPYFKCLADLDEWFNKPHRKLDGVSPYVARPVIESDNRGKLLVCHDYKGGYTERPSAFAYTFNFWSYCDIFIYFSHHTVTIPPAGWINAAHRQGVKMLGTLIFEHDEGVRDCLRLLVGRLPQSKTGSAAPSQDNSFPLSPHYARILAELAYERGFDGYLLNVEVRLIGLVEQARALAAWIAVLNSELKRKVGSHAEAIWYDSVVITGDLRWQDRLNNYNLPFFIPSTGFFTNYTWHPDYPSLVAQYFFTLDAALVKVPKRLQDIYVGIDVWGRGQHGGGGFGSYRALTHIDPEFLGLSVALFAPAWSWDTEKDKLGFSWETWWAYERKLWLGPQVEGEVVEVPPYEPRKGDPDCEHGEFIPISSFFPRRAPPKPKDLPFLTYFSPGVGRTWFVGGAKVDEMPLGWTDMDKTTSLGDLIWPRPSPQWLESERVPPTPKTSSSLCMTDAWLGGSSLNISLSLLAAEADSDTPHTARGPSSSHISRPHDTLWIPIQTIAMTPAISYTVTLVYKVAAESSSGLNVVPSVKDLNTSSHSFDVRQKTPQSSGLPHGWSTRTTEIILLNDSSSTDVSIALGLEVSLGPSAGSSTIDILVGLLSVHQTSDASATIQQPKILWADYARQSTSASALAGTLSWEIAMSLGPLTGITLATDPEDPTPLWRLDPSFPAFAFFNVYVQAFQSDWRTIGNAESATWIGTTGLDGKQKSFRVDPSCLPPALSQARAARFYVQGVTDRGEILTWDKCVFVDVHSTR